MVILLLSKGNDLCSEYFCNIFFVIKITISKELSRKNVIYIEK